MPPVRRRLAFKPAWVAALTAASALFSAHAHASGCGSNPAFSTCFDANSLWLPAGRAKFVSLPDARVDAVGVITFGLTTEWLRRPVLLHLASPDRDGRNVDALGDALDASLLISAGVWKNIELTLATPARLYQSGSGAGGVSSQTAPAIAHGALRNPRLGLGYSLNDALGTRGLGVRLALEASLPLAGDDELAGETSVVLMPSATLAAGVRRFRLAFSAGARLRRRLDVGEARLGNQAFLGLGFGMELLEPGLLFVGVEAFGLPPLASSQASQHDVALRGETLFPAEWLASVHTCFHKQGHWTLGIAAGSGIPLSSETRLGPTGSGTDHFLGLTTPSMHSLVMLRFAPPEAAP